MEIYRFLFIQSKYTVVIKINNLILDSNFCSSFDNGSCFIAKNQFDEDHSRGR